MYSNDRHAGFTPDGTPVIGFSPLHDDGTGGQPSLGMFQLMPITCIGGIQKCPFSEKDRAAHVVDDSVGELAMSSSVIAVLSDHVVHL